MRSNAAIACHMELPDAKIWAIKHGFSEVKASGCETMQQLCLELHESDMTPQSACLILGGLKVKFDEVDEDKSDSLGDNCLN